MTPQPDSVHVGTARVDLEVDTTDAVRQLKKLEFQARKAAKACAEALELRRKCEELGIEFIQSND